jgi:hypothetical protein
VLFLCKKGREKVKKDIQMIRGTTQILNISVTDANKSPYVLGSGEFLLFGVKAKPEDNVYVVLKPVSSGADGVYTVTLAPDDTNHLPYGRYVYDVGLQSGNNYYNIIPTSGFAVLPNVTKWGDGA